MEPEEPTALGEAAKTANNQVLGGAVDADLAGEAVIAKIQAKREAKERLADKASDEAETAADQAHRAADQAEKKIQAKDQAEKAADQAEKKLQAEKKQEIRAQTASDKDLARETVIAKIQAR